VCCVIEHSGPSVCRPECAAQQCSMQNRGAGSMRRVNSRQAYSVYLACHCVLTWSATAFALSDSIVRASSGLLSSRTNHEAVLVWGPHCWIPANTGAAALHAGSAACLLFSCVLLPCDHAVQPHSYPVGLQSKRIQRSAPALAACGQSASSAVLLRWQPAVKAHPAQCSCSGPRAHCLQLFCSRACPGYDRRTPSALAVNLGERGRRCAALHCRVPCAAQKAGSP